MDARNVCSRLEVVFCGLTKSDHFGMHGLKVMYNRN